MRGATVQRVKAGEMLCRGAIALPWPLQERSWAVRMRTEAADGRYVASWSYLRRS